MTASSSLRALAAIAASFGALFAVVSSCTSTPQRIEPAASSGASAGENGSGNEDPNIETDAGLRCLPQKRADLAALFLSQPFAPRDGAPDGRHLVTVTRGKPRWMAAFNAALAWQNGECEAFATFAELMGYEASEVTDTVTNTRHWVLSERASRYNGSFAFRVPDERDQALPLVVAAPHFGSSFTDDRAVRLYRDAGGAVLLQSAAHRCGLSACSACITSPGDACGGCARASDAAHSVDQLLFAVVAGLSAVRKDFYFEYDEREGRAGPASCAQGSIHLSQGADELSNATDEGAAFADRFYKSITTKARVARGCACYQPRDAGCAIAGGQSVLARLVNQESRTPFDPCTEPAKRVSGRFLHFEGSRVPVETVVAAVREALQ